MGEPKEQSHEDESERCAEGSNVAEGRKIQALKAECVALEMRRHVILQCERESHAVDRCTA